MKYSS